MVFLTLNDDRSDTVWINPLVVTLLDHPQFTHRPDSRSMDRSDGLRWNMRSLALQLLPTKESDPAQEASELASCAEGLEIWEAHAIDDFSSVDDQHVYQHLCRSSSIPTLTLDTILFAAPPGRIVMVDTLCCYPHNENREPTSRGIDIGNCDC